MIKTQMDATENSVKGAGWLDKSPDGLNPIPEAPIEPEMQPGSKWKAAVQDRRQEILAERNAHIPEGASTSKDTHQ